MSTIFNAVAPDFTHQRTRLTACTGEEARATAYLRLDETLVLRLVCPKMNGIRSEMELLA